ncbi:hypothetical protein SKAU_G00182670 [Synaphobranchus kaupii]|uniref:Brain and acute leukemia cytoplasmic protein n=1 Tax=Synaphobranchus kaupii TaxID=118154 RepID=A0A9Q1FBV7_SYNKA|nr:hypothetical protein SKAU_G00182670 [Synaphobranchus kaupii]
MGCGSSRTDALEPRYLESWTKETESTWLPGTDTDVPLSSIRNIPSENASELGFTAEKNSSSVADLFDDSFPGPAQAYMKVCSAMSEASLSDTKVAPASRQQEALSSHGNTLQKRSVMCTEEITEWRDNRMSTKQVTITVTQSVRQVDRGGWMRETSRTTFEVLKPSEDPKEAPARKNPK